MTDIEYLKKYLSKEQLDNGLQRLQNGEPVQYIVGNVDFYGNIFGVNKNVLIPRFETEELVNETIKIINKYFDNNIDIVDLGTGSGCIAITLKEYIKNSNVDAVDISKEALEIAKENSINLKQKVNFYLGDMLKPLTKKYDVIISNPPYIRYDEEIMDIVKNNEPHLALYASNDGLKYYEDILNNASKYLKEKSLIAFEIGYLQGAKVKQIASNNFPNSRVIVKKDMQGKDRFVFIYNNIDVN